MKTMHTPGSDVDGFNSQQCCRESIRVPPKTDSTCFWKARVVGLRCLTFVATCPLGDTRIPCSVSRLKKQPNYPAHIRASTRVAQTCVVVPFALCMKIAAGWSAYLLVGSYSQPLTCSAGTPWHRLAHALSAGSSAVWRVMVAHLLPAPVVEGASPLQPQYKPSTDCGSNPGGSIRLIQKAGQHPSMRNRARCEMP